MKCVEKNKCIVIKLKYKPELTESIFLSICLFFFIEKMFNVNKVVGITTVIHILDTNSFSFSDEKERRTNFSSCLLPV